MYSKPSLEFIIKDTHRGLWYEDGRLTKVLEAGKYKIPRRWWPIIGPTINVDLIDMPEEQKRSRCTGLRHDFHSVKLSSGIRYWKSNL